MDDIRTAPATVLTVVSDTICPWCWIGMRRLDAARAMLAAEGLRFTRVWHPFMLNPDMPQGGMARAAYRAAKFGSLERGAALDARVAAEGAREGLEFRFDRMARTPNTRDSHRLLRLAAERGGPVLADVVAEALFTAYFRDGRDIGDAAVLGAIGDESGLPAGAAAAMLAGTDGTAEVARDASVAAGIGGVPAFVVGRQVVISGAERAEAMAAALRAALTQAR